MFNFSKKASFLLCCSRQSLSYDWISNVLDMNLPVGVVLTFGQLSFEKIVHDDESCKYVRVPTQCAYHHRHIQDYY